MIEVQGLTKYYGRHAAIADLTFSVAQGEIVGFLGLNGAGKSTTLKILGCVLLPSAGRVTVNGLDTEVAPQEIRRQIGFLPDTPPLYNEMAVGKFLAFVARLRGVAEKDVARHVGEAEEKTALTHKHDDLISSLSHGYRQRVGIAQALVHKPPLLILDEPAGGLDPVQIVEMRNLIKGLRGAHTVLLSSHILSEISQTCDRLLVIQAGRIVAQGGEAELAAAVGAKGHIEVDVEGDAERARQILEALPDVTRVEISDARDGRAACRVFGPVTMRPRIARALVEGGLELHRLDRGGTELENVFIELTRGGGASS